jgi:hypothetical protein
LRKVDQPLIEKWRCSKRAHLGRLNRATVHEGYSPFDAQVRASYPKVEVRPCRPEGTEEYEKALERKLDTAKADLKPLI